MTLTHYGFREWGGGAAVGALLLVGAWYLSRWSMAGGVALAVVTVVLWLALAAFFRSPRRRIPADGSLILSPADGVVRDVDTVEDLAQPPFTGRARRVGIFLSVLNVHLNRAPAAWAVESKVYRAGHYLDARNPACARENEAMTLAGTADAGAFRFPLAVRQISGAIARRIVCPVDPGRRLARGQAYGMIKFGSRTELYLPADEARIEILVKPGDTVRAGVTAIARIKLGEEVRG